MKAQDMRRVASHGRRARWASTARADAAGRDLHCGSALLRMRTLRVHGERCSRQDQKCAFGRLSVDHLNLQVVIQRQDDAAILGTLDARDAREL